MTPLSSCSVFFYSARALCESFFVWLGQNGHSKDMDHDRLSFTEGEMAGGRQMRPPQRDQGEFSWLVPACRGVAVCLRSHGHRPSACAGSRPNTTDAGELSAEEVLGSQERAVWLEPPHLSCLPARVPASFILPQIDSMSCGGC